MLKRTTHSPGRIRRQDKISWSSTAIHNGNQIQACKRKTTHTSVSLVDAGLARMSRDETELVIGPLEGCRDGHGLGDHGLGQLLASLDRNG